MATDPKKPLRTVSGETGQSLGDMRTPTESHTHKFTYEIYEAGDHPSKFKCLGTTDLGADHTHLILNPRHTEISSDGHYHVLPVHTLDGDQPGKTQNPAAIVKKEQGQFDVLKYIEEGGDVLDIESAVLEWIEEMGVTLGNNAPGLAQIPNPLKKKIKPARAPKMKSKPRNKDYAVHSANKPDPGTC